MSEPPKPEECSDGPPKKKGSKVLLLGILFTAVALGAVSTF